jgi:sugar phosphate permease
LTGSFTGMLIVRALFGISEGPFAPAASKAVALWFTDREVGRANGIQLASINIGAAVAPLIVSPLVTCWGWRSVFLVLFLPGLLLAAAVSIVFARPSKGAARQASDPAPGEVVLSVRQVLKTPAVLWCAATLFFGNMAGWGLMNWLPTYLLQARGFSVARMGIFASLPFLAGAVGYCLGGYLSDRYFKQRRKIPVVGGLIFGAVMTFLAARAPSGEWAVLLLAAAFLFLFVSSASLFTLPLVIVPREAVGASFGVVNTAGQVAAFLSPLVVGMALERTQDNFVVVFYGIVAVFGIAALAGNRIEQVAVGGRARRPSQGGE